MTQEILDKFPWRRLFRLAMAQGLDPQQVWEMTAGELHLSLLETREMSSRDAPVTPQVFEALQQYCSGEEGKSN